MGFIDDIKGVFERDPAAKNVAEVLLCYPGLHALWMHRIANFFWKLKLPLIPRLISHMNRFLTGIEIHPGATIGKRFFIDHGSGVVIGETTEIEDNVLLYSEVVLGGTSLQKKKRHPTLHSNVVVGAGAKVLGALDIGEGARIGAGSVVVKDVPAGATVVGIPAKIVKREKPSHEVDLRHGDLPDPLARCVECMMDRIDSLQKEMSQMKDALYKKELGVQAAEEVLAREGKPVRIEDDQLLCRACGMIEGDKDGAMCEFHKARADFEEFRKKSSKPGELESATEAQPVEKA